MPIVWKIVIIYEKLEQTSVRLAHARHNDRMTHGPTDYCNPRCACAPRVNDGERWWSCCLDHACLYMPKYAMYIYIGAETWCASMNQFVTISSLLERLYAYHTKSKSAQSCRKCPYAHDIDAQNRCRKVTPHEGLLPRWTPTCPPNVVGPLVCSNFTWAPFGCTPKFQSVPSFCLWGCCSGPGKGTGILASGLKLQREKFNDLKISLQPPCAFTHVCTCMHRQA